MDFENLKIFIKELFDVIKLERKVIFFLIIVIISMKCLSMVYIKYAIRDYNLSECIVQTPKSLYFQNNLKDKAYTIDTLKSKIRNFDPNNSTENELIKIGFSKKLSKTIYNYTSKGGRFYKKEDLKKIWGLDSSVYSIIKDYILINVSKSESFSSYKNNNNNKSENIIIDINKSNVEDFVKLNGIGDYYANKIIKLRDNLGSFYDISQLNDKYNALPDSVFEKIENKLKISDKKIKKININISSYQELDLHPYILPWQAKEIVENRPIKDEESLLKLRTFTKPTYQKGLKYFEY